MRMVEPLRQRLPTVWELRSDRAIALGLRIGSSRDAGFEPGRASDCRCRPEPLPADAGRHPDVDAGIDRWMPSSEGGGRACSRILVRRTHETDGGVEPTRAETVP